MLPIRTCYMGIILLATHSVLAHCAQEPSAMSIESADNKNTMTMHKRPSFFVGSRYGRSGSNVPLQSLFATSKARRLSVAPRNDRFFLGSRYGKRADEYMSPYEQDTDTDTDSETVLTSSSSLPSKATAVENRFDTDTPNAEEASAPIMMSCIYTGHIYYYRCTAVDSAINH